jgi:hypothetical protein
MKNYVHGVITIWKGKDTKEIVLEQIRLFTVIDLITFLFPFIENSDIEIVKELIRKREKQNVKNFATLTNLKRLN